MTPAPREALDPGPRTPDEEKRLRMLQALKNGVTGGAQPTVAAATAPRPSKAKRSSGKSGEPADGMSFQALQLAAEFDKVPESRIELKVGDLTLTFSARCWFDDDEGTAILCTTPDQLKIRPAANGMVYSMRVNNRPYNCLFLGIQLSLGLTITLLPLKVEPA